MTTTAEELVQLLAKTARGETKAFDTLYQRTSAQLFGLCIFMLKDKSLAEEVLQEAYLKIWNNAKEYHSERGQVITWMSSITRYCAIDALRKLNRQPVTTENASLDILEQEPALEMDIWGEQQLLLGCLDELSAQQRKSISMAFLEGFTHPELASALEAPLGSVKSWIRRGLLSLRRCLQQ